MLGSRARITGWCCQCADESTGGWDGSDAELWQAFAWCGRTCGSVGFRVSDRGLFYPGVDFRLARDISVLVAGARTGILEVGRDGELV